MTSAVTLDSLRQAIQAQPITLASICKNPWFVNIVGGLIAAAVLAVLGLLVRLFRQKRKQDYLVSAKRFYREENELRHKHTEFQEIRVEGGVERRVLDELGQLLHGNDRVLVLSGICGMGKSRLLLELGHRMRNLKFVNTCSQWNYDQLARGVDAHIKSRQVLALDDAHEHLELLSRLLDVCVNRAVRLIAAGRYENQLRAAIERSRVTACFVLLGAMDNPAEIVTKDPELARQINQIAQGNPAVAVMAFDHYLRTNTLHGIKDSFGLMQRVLAELVEAGSKAGAEQPQQFLAEMAIRMGLGEDDEALRRNMAMVAEVKKMRHIVVEEKGRNRFYRIYPDMLRDFIVRVTYFSADEILPVFDQMLARLPLNNVDSVITMLGLLQREHESATAFKRACARVLDMVRVKAAADQKVRIEAGCVAYAAFGHYQFVTEYLGDFCAGAETLDSTYYLGRAGDFYQATGQPDRARACYQKALGIATAAQDKKEMAIYLHNLGMIAQDQGNYPEARRLYEESLKLERELGDKSGIAKTLGQLGKLAEQEKDDATAARNYLYALTIFTLLNSPNAAIAKNDVARVRQRLGDERLSQIVAEVKNELAKQGIDGSSLDKELET